MFVLIILNERAMAKLSGTYHSQQHGKKRVRPTSFTIISFLSQQTCIRILMKHDNDFWRILCFIFAKVIGFFQFVKTFGYAC
jgi:hypothetical protein